MHILLNAFDPSGFMNGVDIFVIQRAPGSLHKPMKIIIMGSELGINHMMHSSSFHLVLNLPLRRFFSTFISILSYCFIFVRDRKLG